MARSLYSLYCSFAYTQYTVREKRDIEAIMSSHFVVPNWRNLNHQKQLEEQIKEEVEETAPQGEGGEGRRGGGSQRNRSSSSSSSSHFHTQPFTTLSVPIMSSHYEVTELTWENGQLAMHGLSGGGGGLLPSDPVQKPLWTQVGAGAGADTLESIVHGATTSCPNPNTNPNLNHQKIHSQNHPRNMDSLIASSSEKWNDRNTCQMGPKPMNKRSRSESVPVRRNYSSANDFPRRLDGSACASATFFGDTDTNMMTVTSSEYSPCSLKAKNTDEDSAFHDSRRVNQDEECDQTKTETGRSHSSRRIRVAAVHNQSERKRRDRINQKMKALQKLVPNSSKTDKASMLDEVIGYLKQLQTQIQMIQSVGNTMPNPHQMLMPSTAMGIQQQQQQQQQLQQMSLLARMATGMGLGGMGMGMLDMNSMASSAFPSLLAQPTRPSIPTTTTPAFVPSPFLVPQMMQARMNMSVPGSSNNILNPSLPMPNPYSALLQQSMNMELYNKMAAFYGQQLKQTTQEPMSSNSSQMKHIHNRD